MNIKEAQDVALSFQGESFTPPPRSIDDIVQRINKADLPYSICGLCSKDEEPGATLDERLVFYSLKGIALHRSGDTINSIKYTHKALDLLAANKNRVAEWKTHISVYNRALQVFESTGRYSQAIYYGEQSTHYLISLSPKGKAAAKVFTFATLAHHYARTGKINKAKNYYNDAQAQFKKVTARWGSEHPQWSIWNGALSYATSHIKQAEGDLRGAELALRESIKWFQDFVEGRQLRQKQMHIEAQGLYLVEVLLEQGRIAEAELESRMAIENALDGFGRNTVGSASVIMGLAKVMMARSRYADAERLADISNDILNKINATKSSSYFSQTLNILAESRLAQGKYKSALKTFSENEKNVIEDKLVHRAFVATNINYALALFKDGKLRKANIIASNAVKFRTKLLGDEHFSVKEAKAVVSLIKAKNDNTSSRFENINGLIKEIAMGLSDGSSDQIGAGTVQTRYKIIIEEYLTLLARHYDNSAIMTDWLFQAAQLGRSQGVQKALSASAARAKIGDPELAQLVRQEQDAAFMVDAAYNALARA